ncbi:hypothetical protein J4E91_006014 [Alternaria rosae]|nr:hypothetical protein J4E91_006014 [Alternaria rosae]
MAGLAASGTAFVIDTFSGRDCGGNVQQNVNIWDNTCATWPEGFGSFKITTWGGSHQYAYFFAPDNCGYLPGAIGVGYVDSSTNDFVQGSPHHNTPNNNATKPTTPVNGSKVSAAAAPVVTSASVEDSVALLDVSDADASAAVEVGELLVVASSPVSVEEAELHDDQKVQSESGAQHCAKVPEVEKVAG